ADIMKGGGFNAVIGNPPYIRIQTMKEWAPAEIEFYKKHYSSANSGNYDIYVIFVEKGLELLDKKGLLGFILPHKFFNAKYGEPLRNLISQGQNIHEIVHFGHQQVFENATTYTCLLFLNKIPQTEFSITKVDNLFNWRSNPSLQNEGKLDCNLVRSVEWNFVVGENSKLFDKLKSMPTKLENVTERIFQGIKTSADKIYIVNEVTRNDKIIKIYSPHQEREYEVEHTLFHPLIKGGDGKRYSIIKPNRLILFPYEKQNNLMELIPENKFKANYPLTWAYLIENKKYLENREEGKFKGDHWYQYGRNQALEVIDRPKIFTPDLIAHVSFSLDKIGDLFFPGGAAGGYGILVSVNYSREYILGLINSNLLNWFLRQISSSFRGGWFSAESRFIRYLPIRIINFSDSTDIARHDKMITLVERMLDLNKRLPEARTDQEQTLLKRQIAATDKEIDELVYELYGLTEEEIAIVESGGGNER
ncbi:MAG: Eco57I restriction-modification methylase domain-containing protein, partial [Methanomicrobiales archaeon]|nr:Eco57I restriction-modification methylase domain-containing protein [Methanomicrobiales archaeon]